MTKEILINELERRINMAQSMKEDYTAKALAAFLNRDSRESFYNDNVIIARGYIEGLKEAIAVINSL